MTRRRTVLCSLLLALPAWPQQATKLTLAEQEAFLANAKVVSTKSAPGGITGSLRATLSDGKITHDAHIQYIDEYRTSFTGNRGTEINFRDSYKFNVAAYRLDQMLELNMIPPSIVRSHGGKSSSFTWWVDDVMMDEGKRLKTKAQAPDSHAWNCQMYLVRMFDQLIFNTDRNLGNLVISKDWRIWMIDHTRAFRTHTTLQEKKNLAKCDRAVLAKLKELTEDKLTEVMKNLLTTPEIKGMLARRDKIVQFYESAGPQSLFTMAHAQ